MNITTFSMDIAKNVFQIQGYTGRREKVLIKRLKRGKVLSFYAEQEGRCRVVMEACGSAHYWGRELAGLGYEVILLPAQHVSALVVGNKTDAHDADAIYEASLRPKIRPVPLKSEEQQALLAVHRIRERLMKGRTALINQIRGLLAEHGVVFSKRVAPLRQGLVEWFSQTDKEALRELISELWEEWQALDERIKHQDRKLARLYRAIPGCGLIGEIGGIGTVTATALVASVGDARVFDSGRQMSAWLGLTPREHSSGDRRQLQGITKRGDGYLRKLLVHGARAVVQRSRHKTDARSRWIQDLVARRGHNKAVVAVANKNARIVWAMLRTGECYRHPQPLAA